MAITTLLQNNNNFFVKSLVILHRCKLGILLQLLKSEVKGIETERVKYYVEMFLVSEKNKLCKGTECT